MAKPTDRPSPVPLPTSLVVKNGSKTRRAFSAEMPGPSSAIVITTLCSSAWLRMVSVPLPCASNIACCALVIRLAKTFCSWWKSPRMKGSFGSSSAFTSMRQTLRSYDLRSIVLRITPFSPRGFFSGFSRRAKISKFLTMRAARSASLRMMSIPLASLGSGLFCCMSCAYPSTPHRGLFSSCATPERRLPRAVIFSVWMTSSWVSSSRLMLACSSLCSRALPRARATSEARIMALRRSRSV